MIVKDARGTQHDVTLDDWWWARVAGARTDSPDCVQICARGAAVAGAAQLWAYHEVRLIAPVMRPGDCLPPATLKPAVRALATAIEIGMFEDEDYKAAQRALVDLQRYCG